MSEIPFYKNGRCRVEVQVQSGGVVRFAIHEGFDLHYSEKAAVYGSANPPKWWRTGWPRDSIADAARRAISKCDQLEREWQEAEFHTEIARNEVTALVETHAALASLERELRPEGA